MDNKGWQIKTKDGKIYGPADMGTLEKWIQENRISSEDYVWNENKKEWVNIKSIPELRDLFSGKREQKEKQKIPEVRVSEEKNFTDTLHDDKNLLTFQLIADAWRAMLAKGIWSIIGALFLIGAVGLSGVFIIVSLTHLFILIPSVSWLIEQFILLIIFASLNLGWMAYSLKIARGERVNVGSIFEGFKGVYIWCALGAILLIQLFTGLAGLVSLGIWGFYLAWAYSLSYFFIFDENRGPWEAMKASYNATKGYQWRMVAVWTVCMIIGMLCLVIGLFVTIPLGNIAIASLYYRIRTNRISDKHKHTQFAEYLIVLVPFLLIIAIIVAIAFVIITKHSPLLLPQMQQILKNLPVKI